MIVAWVIIVSNEAGFLFKVWQLFIIRYVIGFAWPVSEIP